MRPLKGEGTNKVRGRCGQGLGSLMGTEGFCHGSFCFCLWIRLCGYLGSMGRNLAVGLRGVGKIERIIGKCREASFPRDTQYYFQAVLELK